MADRRIAEATHFGELFLAQPPYFSEKLYAEPHTFEKGCLPACILCFSFHFVRYPFLKMRNFLLIMITTIPSLVNVVL